MKVKVTYWPEEAATARAVIAAVRALFPAVRQHENETPTGVKCVFLTVKTTKKPRD
jgi:hypothetical protein